jgi:hypothetical protein
MKAAHVCLWHEAAVRRVQNYVRFLGYSGREMLAVRLSHFDLACVKLIHRRNVKNTILQPGVAPLGRSMI